MRYASPIWLLGLLLWAAAGAYLWTRSGRRGSVPFLALWPTAAGVAPQRRRWRRPAAGVLLMIVAMALAVVAGGRPERRAVDRVAVVVDRGRPDLPAGQDVALKAATAAVARTATVSVRVVPVPGNSTEINGPDWTSTVARLAPVATSRGSVEQAVRGQLSGTAGVVVVLSDRTLAVHDRRIVQFRSTGAAGVEIAAVAARARPRGQVMVRLSNAGQSRPADVVVSSGAVTVRRTVALPAHGVADLFADIPRLDQSIRVTLQPQEGRSPAGQAWLARRSSFARLEVAGTVPESVARMARVYVGHHPPGVDAAPVLVTDRPLAADQAGVTVCDGDGIVVGGGGAPTVQPGPLTAAVTNWPRAATVVAPPAGFAPVVTRGGSTLVASRSDPVRQVWVDADLRAWSRTTDFVVFCSNALDWVGNADERFDAERAHAPPAGWERLAGGADAPDDPLERPGLYRSDRGRLVAMNAAPGAAGSPPVWPDGRGVAAPAIAPQICAASLAAVLLATLVWRAASPPTTLPRGE